MDPDREWFFRIKQPLDQRVLDEIKYVVRLLILTRIDSFPGFSSTIPHEMKASELESFINDATNPEESGIPAALKEERQVRKRILARFGLDPKDAHCVPVKGGFVRDVKSTIYPHLHLLQGINFSDPKHSLITEELVQTDTESKLTQYIKTHFAASKKA